MVLVQENVGLKNLSLGLYKKSLNTIVFSLIILVQLSSRIPINRWQIFKENWVWKIWQLHRPEFVFTYGQAVWQQRC